MQRKSKIAPDRASVATEPGASMMGSTTADRFKRSSRHFSVASTFARGGADRASLSATTRQRPRGHGTSRQHQQPPLYQHQYHAITTLLQRRDRLRVYDDEGADATPRALSHSVYASLEDRRTAFDTIGQLMGSSGGGGDSSSRAASLHSSHLGGQRPSLATISSYSSIYTIDEILAAKVRRSDSFGGSGKGSTKGSGKCFDVVEDDEEAPSQFHLPRFDSREFYSYDDKITITLKETETFFLFELAQLTEDARTDEGRAVIESNERYEKIRGGAGRKTVDAEAQTAQLYTKSRGTYIGRPERKNRATFVNNWVMYDTYHGEETTMGAGEPHENRFKFPATKPLELRGDTSGDYSADRQLASIAARDEYEDATRVTLRILASKNYEVAQKRFAGLLRQDPADPSLELVYGLELLWRHAAVKTQQRPVSAFRWNPVNLSLLAVGYAARVNAKQTEDVPKGLLLIWCAKNPSEPDRCYEFNSPISDLDWSTSRPNLLAVGFYDGLIRVIDVSRKQLTVVRQSQRKTSPSYGQHWQIQWWASGNEPYDSRRLHEQLYTSNQDGRVCYYLTDEDFASHEILHLQRIEGKIPGVRRVNHCLGHDVPISRHAGALLLRRHPVESGVYLVGTDEGCVQRCSLAHPHSHLDSFLAHDGPIYGLEYSPYCPRLLLSCGADWTARVWAEGLDEPLLTFGTRMASVMAAAWSPRNSTIFASAVANEICIWDLRRKTHRPASITRVAPTNARLLRLEFTRSGEQLVAADDEGAVYVYGLVGMPLPAFDQEHALVDAVEKALLTRPELLKRLRKLGRPFSEESL